jgi:multidrug efflux pump subunit AcrB
MNGLIRASLNNPYAVTVAMLTLVILGVISVIDIPIDILPVFKSPAVQVLTFYGGMPAESVANDITIRMERNVGQAAGTRLVESRSIVGASIVRSYFQPDADPNGALTQATSLAFSQLATMPPGTLPPVVLPFDPTSTVPACIIALNSDTAGESALYDVGRYEVRNLVMALPGAVAPVVFGGKVRAVIAYLDRLKLEARQLSPLDVMRAMDNYNLFLPTGDAKLGGLDYALDSNSMFGIVDRMNDIPLRTEHGNAAFLRDVGTAKDSSFIQTNIVRVNGRKQVYIPVFRQLGASTLKVVDGLKATVEDMKNRLSRTDIDLKVVMDQSVYVRQSIASLVQEGALGAILCSLVILIFLGQWQMTAIAVMTIPIAVLAAIICLKATGNTINVMTLAGLSLAIGPMVDSAIICLENTHRHLGMGASPREAAYLGASEVAMPELVSTLCTFLVLAPLVMIPSLGDFLFKPMAMAVAFAMIAAYFLSRTFVPSRAATWLKGHGHEGHAEGNGVGADPDNPYANLGTGDKVKPRKGRIARAFAKWEATIEKGIAAYGRGLDAVMRHPRLTIGIAVTWLGSMVVLLGPVLRREFFPEVDAGAFEMTVRGPSGTRIEITNDRIEAVEKFIREQVPERDLQVIISEIGVTPDWSAAYTPNAGPMDAIVRVQLEAERSKSAQEYVAILRRAFAKDTRFADLEFAFDAGGMIRGAMNEGKSTPINVRVLSKNMAAGRRVAELIRDDVIKKVDGVVDVRIIERLDYPEFMIEVDRAKAADLELTQEDVMKNLIAAFNSSIQFNKHNFWIDPKTHNQYFVGVQYPEADITSIETLLNVPITSESRKTTVPMRNIVSIRRTSIPSEVVHSKFLPTFDLTMSVEGRDLGHVADDVNAVVATHGVMRKEGGWTPYDPSKPGEKVPMKGSQIVISGEYQRMQETFYYLGIGLILAVLLMYFLMVGLDRSYIVPLTVLSTVPLALGGVLPMLYFTGTALNVQSLLGIIFIVGIKVANTVLITDFAQELRHSEGLSPSQAIRKAASMRVRPVTMTALAAFFAMIPASLALERGSEANAPLGRAILGGLLAGEPATLFVLPCFYMLMVRDRPGRHGSRPDEDGEPSSKGDAEQPPGTHPSVDLG